MQRRVSMVHDALAESKQFKPELGSKAEHNKKVKQMIEDEVCGDKENSYDKVLVERAIQRYFESRKINVRESDPSQKDRVAIQAKSRRQRSRRSRLFKRREKEAHEGPERERFKQLTLDYMSAESSSEETSNAVTVHKHKWRSDKLNKFLEELDKRASEAHKDSKKYVPERRLRIQGAYLDSVPPPGAMKWTISSDWQKDNLQQE